MRFFDISSNLPNSHGPLLVILKAPLKFVVLGCSVANTPSNESHFCRSTKQASRAVFVIVSGSDGRKRFWSQLNKPTRSSPQWWSGRSTTTQYNVFDLLLLIWDFGYIILKCILKCDRLKFSTTSNWLAEIWTDISTPSCGLGETGGSGMGRPTRIRWQMPL